MAWTDDRVELLRKLWIEGQSASQIAKELGGVTRNAVIGKVHRLGLSNRAGAGDEAKKVKTPTKLKPEQKKTASGQNMEDQAAKLDQVGRAEPPAASNLPQIIPADKRLPPQPSANEISPEALASHRDVMKNALRLSLMELTERTCKWPIGDPATDDFWFCGLPVEPGKCYCDPCARVAYQPASARRDRRR